MSKSAGYEDLERICAGEPAAVKPQQLLDGDRIDDAIIDRIAQGLDEGDAAVRLRLARLLIDLGFAAEPLSQSFVLVQRDPRVIAALLGGSLGRADEARLLVLQMLATTAPREVLEPHSRAITADLLASPDGEALDLVAKAKPPQAVAVVRKLIGNTSLADNEQLLVVSAALGNTQAERLITEPFVATSDPWEKARLANMLGQVGTWTALRTLANDLRTQLVREIGITKQSLREPIIGAIAESFPTQPEFVGGFDDASCAAVERFCQKHFAIHLD